MTLTTVRPSSPEPTPSKKVYDLYVASSALYNIFSLGRRVTRRVYA